MLFAYGQHPGSFGDRFDAAGQPGANGVPDVLDEAKWGLDWMLKMNPGPGEYYNQIADDRDHQRMRLPTLDSGALRRTRREPGPAGLFHHRGAARRTPI